MRAAALALLLAGCSQAAPSRSPDMGSPDLAVVAAGDALPPGAILFYKQIACPVGWSVYGPARGRFIVPTAGNVDGGIGGTVGTPLSNAGDDPSHDHSLDGGIALDSTSYVGIGGEANHGVARDGQPALMLSATPSSTGLPYVQLLICQKHAAAPVIGTAPKGMVAFFESPACPAEWTEYAPAAGRHLVGLPGGSQPGGFGGQPLAPGEDRPHSHSVAGNIATNSHGIALAGGCCAGGYARNGTYPFTIASGPSSSGLPHIQLRACLKN
jgi:hypothetical protein